METLELDDVDTLESIKLVEKELKAGKQLGIHSDIRRELMWRAKIGTLPETEAVAEWQEALAVYKHLVSIPLNQAYSRLALLALGETWPAKKSRDKTVADDRDAVCRSIRVVLDRLNELEHQHESMVATARTVVKRGHLDTCSSSLGDYRCSCGIDDLAKEIER